MWRAIFHSATNGSSISLPAIRVSWIIDGADNFCYVHPVKSGFRSDLNLIAAGGRVYSFPLEGISDEPGVQPDSKIPTGTEVGLTAVSPQFENRRQAKRASSLI